MHAPPLLAALLTAAALTATTAGFNPPTTLNRYTVSSTTISIQFPTTTST